MIVNGNNFNPIVDQCFYHSPNFALSKSKPITITAFSNGVKAMQVSNPIAGIILK